MLEITAVILFAALVKKIIDLFKYAFARDWYDVVTQFGAWFAGSLSLWLVGNTPWGTDLQIDGHTVASLGTASVIVAGVLLGSGGSVVHDYFKAIAGGNPRALPPDPARDRLYT